MIIDEREDASFISIHEIYLFCWRFWHSKNVSQYYCKVSVSRVDIHIPVFDNISGYATSYIYNIRARIVVIVKFVFVD